jgi:hypothetical protein
MREMLRLTYCSCLRSPDKKTRALPFARVLGFAGFVLISVSCAAMYTEQFVGFQILEKDAIAKAHSVTVQFHENPPCTLEKGNEKSIPVYDYSWTSTWPRNCEERNESTLHGEWRRCTDTTRVYISKKESNIRYTAEQARECLKGHSLLFMGDSLTRYQYMSLAMLIHSGAFPNRTQRDGDAGPKVRNVCVEGTFNNWRDYYVSSNKMLSNEKNFEVCDCWRSMEGAPNLTQAFDNRYYYNSEANVSISHISALHRDPLLRFSNIPEFEHTPPDWSGPIADMLTGMSDGSVPLPRAKPTVIIWNSGLWKVYEERDAPTLRKINEAARKLVNASGHPGPRLFWKESTARAMYPGATPCTLLEEDEHVKRVLVEELGWSVLPYAKLTAPLMQYLPPWTFPNMTFDSPRFEVWWDAVHFNPFVYEELNQMLLRQICGAV